MKTGNTATRSSAMTPSQKRGLTERLPESFKLNTKTPLASSLFLPRIPKLGQSEIDGTVLNPDQLRLKWEIKQTEEGQNSAGTN
jgi:hypothetical protein